MFNPTPAIAGWFGYPLELDDRLRLIRQAGFESVLLWWAYESAYEPPIPQKCEAAARHGLSVENAHLQFEKMNSIWLDGIEGESYSDELARLVADAGVYSVPTLVIHLTRTSTPPPFTEVGFNRFMRLVETAEKAGVRLAFENLTYVNRLYEFIRRVDSHMVGVCFDSGHNHCRHPERRVCRDFADRIFAVHLHDNDGLNDKHWIPFDGNDDWDNIRSEILASSYTGAWSLEVEHPMTDKFGKSIASREDDPYFGMGAEEYLARAFEAHRRLIDGKVK